MMITCDIFVSWNTVCSGNVRERVSGRDRAGDEREEKEKEVGKRDKHRRHAWRVRRLFLRRCRGSLLLLGLFCLLVGGEEFGMPFLVRRVEGKNFCEVYRGRS